jgi:hypothetical protein
MSDPDDALAVLWSADEPPADDAAFVYEVMARAERRRLAREIIGLAPGCIAAAVILWACAPVIAAGWRATALALAAAGRASMPVVEAPAAASVMAAALMATWLCAWASRSGADAAP